MTKLGPWFVGQKKILFSYVKIRNSLINLSKDEYPNIPNEINEICWPKSVSMHLREIYIHHTLKSNPSTGLNSRTHRPLKSVFRSLLFKYLDHRTRDLLICFQFLLYFFMERKCFPQQLHFFEPDYSWNRLIPCIRLRITLLNIFSICWMTCPCPRWTEAWQGGSLHFHWSHWGLFNEN